MERVPCFKEAWRKAEKVIDFYDQGLHFSAYDFLGHKLLDEPPVHKKTMCVQFFENKHGKTDWVDGTMFGTWVGPMAQELQTKERVLKTQQYVEHFEQHYREVRDTWEPERQALEHHVFHEWVPEGLYAPKRVTKLQLARLDGQRYYEARPIPGMMGQVQVDLHMQALVPDQGMHMPR